MGDDSSVKQKDSVAYSGYARLHSELWGSDPETLLARRKRLCDDPLFRRALALGNLSPRDSVLELGGGVCEPSSVFSEFAGLCVATDKNLDDVCGLGAGKNLLRTMGDSRVSLVAADYDYLPFKDETFDVVFTRASLHHATNLDKVLREVHRVLREGGRLVAQEPGRGVLVSEGFAHRKFYAMEGISMDMNEHVHSIPVWIDSLKRAGMRNTKVECPLWRLLIFFVDNASARREIEYADKLPRLERIAFRAMQNAYTAFLAKAGILSARLPLGLWLYLFGWPPFLAHEFTRNRSGFEYFPVILTARK